MMWFFVFLWQLFACTSTFYLWSFTENQLTHYFPSFQRIESDNRKKYIVKNVAKGGVLMFLTPPALWIINCIVFSNKWDNALIKTMGALYASGDLVAMATMFHKLPITTKIHHTCVGIFAFLNTFILDYTSPDLIWRHAAILAACSAPTYLVNSYLGLRCLREISEKEKKRLAAFALSIYSVFISMSISWNIVLLFLTTWDITVVLYVATILLVYFDDWKLSMYLWDNSSCKKNKV